MKNFESGHIFKKAALSFISRELLTQKEKSYIAKLFKLMDKTGEGKISFDELQNSSLEFLGKEEMLTNDECAKIMR